MAKFRTLEEITLAMLDFIRLAQPELDTKPGAVARDLFVDLPSSEMAKIYTELQNVSSVQSITLATGSELDRLARNYGLRRNTGSTATGVVVFTVNSLEFDINIPADTVLTARNGTSFTTQNDVFFDSTKKSLYRSNAIRLSTDLNLAGIDDQYAVEVAVEGTAPGIAARIGKFQIISQPLFGATNVINTQAFRGGSAAESDDAFRGRILAAFSGSNIGTSLGYINAVLADARVTDAITVEPGDPLMTRDGSLVITNSNGERIIVSSGTGGKIDIIVQGTELQQTSESFIYRDLSGRNDPTDPVNDYVLGQRGINSQLDYQQKRRQYLKGGILPFQPVSQVISLSGSLSGPNFAESFVDADGQERGAFELVKDTGAFGGSSFGFDKIHFISNAIELEDEQTTKTTFNSQDPLDYTDVTKIDEVHQTVSITGEVPTVDPADRSIITLKHTPIISTDRVVNLTTGERYRIVSQNVDGGTTNTTGRVQIAGSTLPTVNDTLSVTYSWDHIYDRYSGYDNLEVVQFTRTVQDSVDWGFANRVFAEETTVLHSVADGYHCVVTHPISRVVNVNTKTVETATNTSGKLNLANTVTNVASVLDSTGREVFYTELSDGSFSGSQITLPSDSILPLSATATVSYNSEDIYSPEGDDTGTFSGSTIKFVDFTTLGATVYVDYVADIPTILPSTSLISLPAVGTENNFTVASSIVGEQPVSNLWSAGSITANLRFSPSFLRMNFSGIVSTGRLAIRGTSFRKVEVVFISLQSGLEIDLSNAIKSALSISTIPSTMYVAKIEKLERVTLSDDIVTSVDFEYDVQNYGIKTATYSDGTGFADATLTSTQFTVQATTANLDEQPEVGSRLRVVAYVADTAAIERVTVPANGIQISKYPYAFVEKIYVESGFLNLSSVIGGSVVVSSYTQPVSGTTYQSSYTYIAPKEGERITITYAYNQLVGDLVGQLEPSRPVTADVLVREARQLKVYVAMVIIATPNFNGSNTTLTQAVTENITSFLNSNGLNATVDYSDIVNNVYTVPGVDRAILSKFNTTNETGVSKTIQAERDQYFVAELVEVTIEDR